MAAHAVASEDGLEVLGVAVTQLQRYSRCVVVVEALQPSLYLSHLDMPSARWLPLGCLLLPLLLVLSGICVPLCRGFY